MSKSVKAMVWGAVVILGPYLLYKIVYPTITYRYRMTVEVEVDGKVHSGSSVIQVKVIKQPAILPDMGMSRREITGQAVYVDLGQGRNVFALLASAPYAKSYDYPAYIVPAHFDLSYLWGDLIKFPFLSGKWTIDPTTPPVDKSPAFVTFGDFNDATTARMVKPTEFPEIFGPGVESPTITIEMTDDPVTTGIYEILPWLDGFKGVTGGKDLLNPNWYLEPGKYLGAVVFSRGIK